MPSVDRRTLLATVGAAFLGGGSGCSALQSGEPPAGSLTFTNDDGSLPHSIRMRVLDVGAELGDPANSVTGTTTVRPAQRTLTATTTVAPGESRTYESVFTEPVWYELQFTVDGQSPENDTGHIAYSPISKGDRPGRTVTGTVGTNGEFRWSIGHTANTGPFDS